MKKIASEKGITMIVTIVTIILILILSGTTIRTIINGGILDQVFNAIDKHKLGEAKEKLNLKLLDYQMRLSNDNNIQGLSNIELYNKVLRDILVSIPNSTPELIEANYKEGEDGEEEIVSVTIIIDGYKFIIDLNPLKIRADIKKATPEELSPVDTKSPIILLNGSSTIAVPLNGEYEENGATVYDNISTGLTATISGTVDTAVESTYYIIYTAKDKAGNEATVRRTVYVTSSLNLQQYAKEMADIESLILDINENNLSKIGTVLTVETKVTIRGINYYDKWYKLTASDVKLINPNSNVTHAPYIVRYEHTPGAVISIEGEIINGTPIHTFNYTGDPESKSLYNNGLLTAVTQDSTKSSTAWGEATIGTGSSQNPPMVIPGNATYDGDGGLVLGDKVGFLTIDQERPVGERYSINVTIKGEIDQNAETYGTTIIAISDTSGKYLAWIRIRSGYLQVITFSTDNKTGMTGNTSGIGFMSKEISAEYNNNFMNIQVISQRSGMSRVYINGELFSEFLSGTAVLSYGNMTIGDLRPARGLKYIGSVYNFALYSEILDQNAITQNWNYFKNELGI